MKFKNIISLLFVNVLIIVAICFVWTNCNKSEPEVDNTIKSNNIVLELSEAETIEENGVVYMERIARPSLADTEQLPMFGFKFSINWANETDKVLEEYLEISSANLLTARLRIKQKFDEQVLLEIVSDPEGYYGAFLLTYEGTPTAIENLPSETTMIAGTSQEFDLSSFNPLNPDASEEFNDFSVEVKYYGAIKVKENIYLSADNLLWHEYGNGVIEGSEKIYTDIFNMPGKADYLVQAKIDGNVLILEENYSISEYCKSPHLYVGDEHKFAPCIVYEKFVECISTPYAEVIITENTSGYVQKIKVWMDV